MPSLGQTSCAQCGGPLPPYAPGATVQCNFCKHSFQAAVSASTTTEEASSQVPGVTHGPDPLPGLVVEGSWQTIRLGHEIVPLLGCDRWLDWEPATGAFHVWAYDRSIGAGDPLPHDVASGSWESIRSGHQLISLGGDHVLDWEAQSGAYRVWQYDSDAKGHEDIFPIAMTEGRWESIIAPARLLYLGDDKLLEWNPTTGAHRIWHYDRPCQNSDPLPGEPIVVGSWESIRSGHELVYCGGDQILAWVPETGRYRIFSYDRGARGNADPLPTELASGSWESIRAGHRLIHLEGDRVLDWEPSTGGYRIWAYGR